MDRADTRIPANGIDTAATGRPLAPDQTPGLSFTGSIAGWSARHRWPVLAASGIAIFLAVMAISVVGTETRRDDGGVGDSGKAYELLRERLWSVPPPTDEPRVPPIPGRTERIIFSNPSLDVTDPAFRSAVDGVVQKIRALPKVVSVVSFYDTGEQGMVADDMRAVLAVVRFQDPDARSQSGISVGPLLDTILEADMESSGFEIEAFSSGLINDSVDEIMEEDFQRILIISLALGLVILVLAFRALVAAVIPLVMALGAIFSAIGVAAVVSQVYALVDLYAEMILMMGLAVGIDYSLFIVSRFRTELKAGRPKLEAISFASSTTGRAVFYAGVTVVLSLTGLMLTRDFTFISMALGAIIVVFIAVVGSLTLLPAMLSALGGNVERLRVPIIGRETYGGGVWGAITDRVLARPMVLATLTLAFLVALAVPVFSLNLGFNGGSDALPDAAEGKRAMELLEEHFSSTLIDPASVVVAAPDVHAPQVQTAVDSLIARLEEADQFPGQIETAISRNGDLVRVRVPVAGKVDDEESENAVKLLRNVIVPELFAATGAAVYVTGDTAESIDFRDRMYDSAPYVFGFVLGLSFLLLMLMFRSIVIPAKTMVLNLLSAAAAYGVLVMVFQWGWGISILGAEATGVIEAWLPLFLFGILFGLSMDYHMLVLNRIKEAYDQGRQNEAAVSAGIRLTAGQITSAAAIMVVVFAAFATSRILGLQQFGVGLAVAVLIDATVIRVVLLPASMKLLGDWNWYLPQWFDWLPKVTSDERGPLAPQPAQTQAGGD